MKTLQVSRLVLGLNYLTLPAICGQGTVLDSSSISATDGRDLTFEKKHITESLKLGTISDALSRTLSQNQDPNQRKIIFRNLQVYNRSVQMQEMELLKLVKSGKLSKSVYKGADGMQDVRERRFAINNLYKVEVVGKNLAEFIDFADFLRAKQGRYTAIIGNFTDSTQYNVEIVDGPKEDLNVKILVLEGRKQFSVDYAISPTGRFSKKSSTDKFNPAVSFLSLQKVKEFIVEGRLVVVQ